MGLSRRAGGVITTREPSVAARVMQAPQQVEHLLGIGVVDGAQRNGVTTRMGTCQPCDLSAHGVVVEGDAFSQALEPGDRDHTAAEAGSKGSQCGLGELGIRGRNRRGKSHDQQSAALLPTGSTW